MMKQADILTEIRLFFLTLCFLMLCILPCGNALRTAPALQGFQGAAGRFFFFSGVDTETIGVDTVADCAFPETSVGKSNATFGANFNSADVTSESARRSSPRSIRRRRPFVPWGTMAGSQPGQAESG